MTMDGIRKLAERYAHRRRLVAVIQEHIRSEVRRIVLAERQNLRRRVAELDVAREDLAAAIQDHQDLFARPRTHSVEGVKFGLRRAQGKLLVGDPARTVALIRQHLPERDDLLVVTERPARRGIRELHPRTLQRIGVTLLPDTEEVVITSATDDLDKLVKVFRVSDDEEDEE